MLNNNHELYATQNSANGWFTKLYRSNIM